MIFTLPFAAALGSIAAKRFNIRPEGGWATPFIGVLLIGAVVRAIYPQLFDTFLGTSQLTRVLIASLIVLPLGLFMGMPFPLGILALQNQPKGAIAWVWGVNGTVLGGAASGILSIFIGFKMTFLVALGIYLLSFVLFARLRLMSCQSVELKESGQRQTDTGSDLAFQSF